MSWLPVTFTTYRCECNERRRRRSGRTFGNSQGHGHIPSAAERGVGAPPAHRLVGDDELDDGQRVEHGDGGNVPGRGTAVSPMSLPPTCSSGRGTAGTHPQPSSHLLLTRSRSDISSAAHACPCGPGQPRRGIAGRRSRVRAVPAAQHGVAMHGHGSHLGADDVLVVVDVGQRVVVVFFNRAEGIQARPAGHVLQRPLSCSRDREVSRAALSPHGSSAAAITPITPTPPRRGGTGRRAELHPGMWPRWGRGHGWVCAQRQAWAGQIALIGPPLLGPTSTHGNALVPHRGGGDAPLELLLPFKGKQELLGQDGSRAHRQHLGSTPRITAFTSW